MGGNSVSVDEYNEYAGGPPALPFDDSNRRELHIMNHLNLVTVT